MECRVRLSSLGRQALVGVDFIEQKALLGHRHVTTTQIYDKRRRTMKEGASHDVPI
jgi:hypothetical protein